MIQRSQSNSLDDVRIFAEVVRRGSFVKAAEALDMPTSTVSRRVAALEAALGTSLLIRTTRKLRLTDQGQDYYTQCASALELLEQARLRLGELQSEPRGLLRVSASVPIGLNLVQPWLIEFQRRYPRLRIDLHLDNRYVDLIGEGFDLAFRGGPLEDSGLRARRIRSLNYVLAASPDYLARQGSPSTPKELLQHDCIGVATRGGALSWELIAGDGTQHRVPIQGPFRSNNVEAAIQAGLAGQGLLYLPQIFMAPELASGLLIPLLADWTYYQRELYAVYAPHPQLSRPLRIMLDELGKL